MRLVKQHVGLLLTILVLLIILIVGLMYLLPQMGDLRGLIQTVGYVGLFAIVFAESGLLVGFFLPGDSLLFTAGILASQGFFEISLLALICFVAAVTGDSFGYFFGRKLGPALFTRQQSVIFDPRHIEKAHQFYEKHGGKTIIIARFTPVIRTFVPIVAGVGRMHYGTFLFYNVIGGLIWGIGLPVLGYALGARIPHIDRYLIPLVAVIILASILPGIIHVMRERVGSKKAAS